MPPIKQNKPNAEAKPAKAKKPKTHEREVIYPFPFALICGDESLFGEHDKEAMAAIKKTFGVTGSLELPRAPALTAEVMKVIMGWTEDKMLAKEHGLTEKLLSDENGKSIWCVHNDRNRPFTEEWARAKAQDMLKKQWRFNGETMIIGRTGRVISAQHRGAGLCLAQQIREGNQSVHWDEVWGEGVPVSINTLIVFGVDESPETTRTLDDVRPRSPADVLFTDTGVFGGIRKEGDRNTVCRMLSYAIRMLWNRTGAKSNAFARYLTNAEVCNYAENHPRLIKAVKHIWEENRAKTKTEMKQRGDKVVDNPIEAAKASYPINYYLSPGYAAALMYLMACSDGDGEAYRNAQREGTDNEKKLTWEHWDKAEEFWVMLGKSRQSDKVGLNTLKEVRLARRPNTDENDGSSYIFGTALGNGTVDERIGTLIKAWKKFVAGGKIKPEDLYLEYKSDEDGMRLDKGQLPLLGGIDLGSGRQEADEGEDAPDPAAPEANGDGADGDDPEQVAKKFMKKIDDKLAKKADPDNKTAELKAAQERARAKKAKAAEANGEAKPAEEPAAPPTMTEVLNDLRVEHPGKVLLFKSVTGYKAWAEDSALVAKAAHTQRKTANGTTYTEVPEAKAQGVIAKLLAAGNPVALCEQVDGQVVVKDPEPAEAEETSAEA